MLTKMVNRDDHAHVQQRSTFLLKMLCIAMAFHMKLWMGLIKQLKAILVLIRDSIFVLSDAGAKYILAHDWAVYVKFFVNEYLYECSIRI